jgi:hypothetical protein
MRKLASKPLRKPAANGLISYAEARELALKYGIHYDAYKLPGSWAAITHHPREKEWGIDTTPESISQALGIRELYDSALYRGDENLGLTARADEGLQTILTEYGLTYSARYTLRNDVLIAVETALATGLEDDLREFFYSFTHDIKHEQERVLITSEAGPQPSQTC